MKRLAMKRVEWCNKHRPRVVSEPKFVSDAWFVVAHNKRGRNRLVRQWLTLTRDRVTTLMPPDGLDKVVMVGGDPVSLFSGAAILHRDDRLPKLTEKALEAAFSVQFSADMEFVTLRKILEANRERAEASAQ